MMTWAGEGNSGGIRKDNYGDCVQAQTTTSTYLQAMKGVYFLLLHSGVQHTDVWQIDWKTNMC